MLSTNRSSRERSENSAISTIAVNRGFALLFSLIFLGILTMIGLTAAQNSILSEKISSNYVNKARSLMAAEYGGQDILKNCTYSNRATCEIATPQVVPSNQPIVRQHFIREYKSETSPSASPSTVIVTYIVTGYATDGKPSPEILAQTRIEIDVEFESTSSSRKVVSRRDLD